MDLINTVAKHSVPTYIFSEVDATWVENLRTKYSLRGKKVSLNAILLKAIAIAQRAHPTSRTTWLPFGKTAVLNEIVAGFTVERFTGGSNPAVFLGAIDEPDTKPLEEISQELRAYAEDEMQDVHQLEQQDRFSRFPWIWRRLVLWLGMQDPSVRLRYMNATFALSSIGKFGCKLLVPPSVSTSTFGVGSLEERPVVRKGQIEIRKMFSLTLNFDHKLIDGAPAARFLKDVVALLEGGLNEYLPAEDLQDFSSDSFPAVTSN
jgi:pyruvate/2-oxoglutarate dehydrogenase complex dihydrolipoamide acyltransferase (E2) component